MLTDNRLVANHVDTDRTMQCWQVHGECLCCYGNKKNVLDVAENNTEAGAELCVWDYHGDENQKFKFVFE